jgi:hypothetical protein
MFRAAFLLPVLALGVAFAGEAQAQDNKKSAAVTIKNQTGVALTYTITGLSAGQQPRQTINPGETKVHRILDGADAMLPESAVTFDAKPVDAANVTKTVKLLNRGPINGTITKTATFDWVGDSRTLQLRIEK